MAECQARRRFLSAQDFGSGSISMRSAHHAARFEPRSFLPAQCYDPPHLQCGHAGDVDVEMEDPYCTTVFMRTTCVVRSQNRSKSPCETWDGFYLCCGKCRMPHPGRVALVVQLALKQFSL